MQVTDAFLSKVEGVLADNKKGAYVTGTEFTPVDAALYVALVNSKTAVNSAKYPKRAAFVGAVSSRPNLAK